MLIALHDIGRGVGSSVVAPWPGTVVLRRRKSVESSQDGPGDGLPSQCAGRQLQATSRCILIGPALNSSSPILSPANFRLAPAEKLYSTDLTDAE